MQPSESFPQVTTIDPRALTVHPLARELPELADDDSDFEALGADIKQRGIIHPLHINKQHQILDGRHRWRWAKILKLALIPVIIVPDVQAISIILESLLLRRHYTKGALAYSAYPMLREAYEEAKKGPALSAASFSIEVQAERFGISERLYRQAKTVHQIFAKDQAYKDLELPKILSGDVGLGAVIAGHGGQEATKGKAKTTASGLKLFTRTWTDLAVRYEHWDKLEIDEKREACQAINTAVEKMPEDLLTNLSKRLKDEIQRRKQEAK
jgi:hypothetical protein